MVTWTQSKSSGPRRRFPGCGSLYQFYGSDFWGILSLCVEDRGETLSSAWASLRLDLCAVGHRKITDGTSKFHSYNHGIPLQPQVKLSVPSVSGILFHREEQKSQEAESCCL